jgi:hypothetical protein
MALPVAYCSMKFTPLKLTSNKDKMKVLQDQIGLTGLYDGAVAI